MSDIGDMIARTLVAYFVGAIIATAAATTVVLLTIQALWRHFHG